MSNGKCTKTNDEQALSALAWHLAGQARCWFESLESPPDTLGALKKVQVGKDQEKAQSEKESHSKNQGGKKPN